MYCRGMKHGASRVEAMTQEPRTKMLYERAPWLPLPVRMMIYYLELDRPSWEKPRHLAKRFGTTSSAIVTARRRLLADGRLVVVEARDEFDDVVKAVVPRS